MTFTTLDYIILALYLLATAAFGTFLGRGQKTTRDYFLGGASMPWWAVSFSIVATETSTLTFIGAPAIAYTGDLTFMQLALGYVLGKVVVSLLLIPAYLRGQLQTAYQLLNGYFGPRVQDLSAVLFLVTRTLADGVRLYATALVLSVVTGVPVFWTVVIIGAVTIVYTFYGGMTAVVWNDVIQLVIYVGGALLAFFIILGKIPGGWDEVVRLAQPADKFRMLNLSFDWSQPYTFISGLIGGAFLTLATHGADQIMVQRYLACGETRKSQVALVFSGAIVLIQFLLFLVIGVMLYAFYQHFPLGQELGEVNRIFPIFIVEQMPSGVSGLIIAAIFAAAMSTLSGSLTSLSSSSLNDFYRRHFVTDASETHYFHASRFLTLGWGVVLIAVSMLARSWGEVLQAGLTINSFTMGSVLGVFLLGAWGRRLTQRGALVAMVTGLLVMLVVSQQEGIAWTWYLFIGAGVTIGVGWLASLFAPAQADGKSAR